MMYSQKVGKLSSLSNFWAKFNIGVKNRLQEIIAGFGNECLDRSQV